MRRAQTLLALAALSLAFGGPARAQEPKVAGTDVAAPHRTKFVAPAYPPEAAMRGLRGIVILELVIDEQGKVASADVVRSVPPFDEAALSAARQWEYEVTQVAGKPVRVRVTVPITFAIRLPEMTRAEGIPEMRQGAAPAFPPGLDGPAQVVADVTLLPDGSVAEAAVRSGESPWAENLLLALRTWRFAAIPEGNEVVFTVQADFVSPGRTGQPPKVDLKLTDPHRREAAAPTAVAPTASASPAPEGAPEPAASPAPGPAVAQQAPPATPSPEPVVASPAPPAAPEPSAPAPEPASAGPAAPPIEVISGPSEVPSPPPPPPPGFSAVRDVSLAAGVPDLVKGRRPVVPPVARMAGANGAVQVTFSVDAAGIASVQKVDGPDLLKEAARQGVASWSFRRTSAERIFLSATYTFEGDQARAEVRRTE
jgi:TonB family protein